MTEFVLKSIETWMVALAGLVLLLSGGILGYWASYQLRKNHLRQLEREVEERVVRNLAEGERAERMELLEEKDNWYKQKSGEEKRVEEQLGELNQRDKGLAQKSRELNKQREEIRKEWGRLKTQEKRLEGREKTVKDYEDKLQETIKSYCERLEVVANLTGEEAKEQLLEELASEVKARSAAMIRAERTHVKEESEREAKKIIAQAVQRCAVEEAVQVSTSTVALPNEGLKSRIIGKEGRNVRTFETATGVKVVVDDTPETVLLSSYDPARREVAARAMERLIKDGGFTPNHIEDVVEQCKKEIEEDMIQAGKAALKDIGATDVHPELPHYVGMLKYRTSYGQNQLQHSLEVAHLAGLMAEEIGLDAAIAQRAGLLHDIGKPLSREMEGSHVELGIELGERFGEHPIVQEVIAEHHEDSDRQSPIFFVVKAADIISSIRPGGRREDPEGYARRIMRLEEIANSFEGVKDVFAINAGREIRVMVQGEKVSDDDAEILAFDIADRVKNELTFAGPIKVIVMRETHAVRYTGKKLNPQRRNSRNGNNKPRLRRPRNDFHHN
jgi:ribonuclease Y